MSAQLSLQGYLQFTGFSFETQVHDDFNEIQAYFRALTEILTSNMNTQQQISIAPTERGR